MRSVLFRIGPVPFHSYGLMVAVGFLVGLWRAVRASGRRGINSAVVVDAALYILLGGVIGARIVYVTHEWSYYRENLAEIPKIWDAGLSFYGALVASSVVAYVYAKRKAIGFARFADLLAPSVALGYAFARIGCFLNGCCGGIPTGLPWGVRFHDPFNSSIFTPPSHPTQLYSSAASLAIFAALVWIDRKGYRDGTVFAAYLALYGGTRFLIEFLRAGPRIAIGPVHLTLAQLVSLPLFAGACLAVVLLNSRGRKTSSGSDQRRK